MFQELVRQTWSFPQWIMLCKQSSMRLLLHPSATGEMPWLEWSHSIRDIWRHGLR
jgi:hypothetical protein